MVGRGRKRKRGTAGERNVGRGEKQVGKRDTLPVTGGKDLGKRKGVAIDYLTGRWEWIFVSDAPRALSLWTWVPAPTVVFRTKRRRALATWDTNKS